MATTTNATGTPVNPTKGATAGPRFSLMGWLKLNAVDLVTMALMGALGLGIYEAPPAPSRSFPVNSIDGNIVYPEFAYPLRREIVPIWAAALIAFFAPFLFFCLFQARRRSLEDLFTTTMGLLKSLITAAVFQVWIKWLIGGLRPHFYEVCKPNVPINGPQRGNGFQGIMYDRSVCTGDKNQIDDSLESMPSGHSTAAFAGLIYLSLYFNAQLKVMSAHNPAYWTMILFFAPILGACLIAGALTIDEFHNWYDVVAGAFIGTATAFVAFRQTFASVWDFRFNHLLLPRGGPAYFEYTFHADAVSSQLPFTRSGGWGVGAREAANGAPFDASGMMGGAGAGAGGYGMGQYGNGSGMTHRTAVGGPGADARV
ncbi:acid phosphatase/Vanadium-dependent haloperoxidase [Exidia glandulosa HHB12029]|uniref:Acid phosphatase/Vanadium-dependent haloperoxidase n=1 Tax=Exidia glandulosa HHB12029 TaxID=1314781 RepID=A0A165F5T8_EXIGL|nr:acid phosphatase/Vanadium-dependent haloperoxidase [Exidia glandulosa HHB12029]